MPHILLSIPSYERESYMACQCPHVTNPSYLQKPGVLPSLVNLWGNVWPYFNCARQYLQLSTEGMTACFIELAVSPLFPKRES